MREASDRWEVVAAVGRRIVERFDGVVTER
jgi:hypothetical protein